MERNFTAAPIIVDNLTSDNTLAKLMNQRNPGMTSTKSQIEGGFEPYLYDQMAVQ